MNFKHAKLLLSLVLLSLFSLAGVNGFEYRKTIDMEVLDAMKLVKAQIGTYDWYGILNLTAEADKKDITRAHRVYSRVYHPDKLKVTPEEHERLVLQYESVQDAVRILKDDMLRPRYDYFRVQGIPIWDRKFKLSRFGIYYGFYVWWYQVYMSPFVILAVWMLGDYLFQWFYYGLAQNAILNNKKVDKYPPKNAIKPLKGIPTQEQLEEQLDRIEKLNRFKVIFLFEDPESVPQASFQRIKLVRLFNYLVKDRTEPQKKKNYSDKQ